MGMDIYEESGVVFTVEEIARRLFRQFTSPEISKAVAGLKKILSDNDDVAKLDSVRSHSDLSEWLESFAWNAVKEEYIDSSSLERVWKSITKSLGIKGLPGVRFEYWTQSRLSGYNVPTEIPCIVFDESKLFEVNMTDRGQKVAKLLGMTKIKPTSWTVMSV